MSEENVELARRGMRSAEEFVGLLDDYVVRDNREYPLIDVPDVEMGREQLEGFLRHYWGTFEDYSIDAMELIDAGQSVVVVLHEQARGRGSGVGLERNWAQVWTFRNGRIIRMEAFRTREEAPRRGGTVGVAHETRSRADRPPAAPPSREKRECLDGFVPLFHALARLLPRRRRTISTFSCDIAYSESPAA